MPPAATAFVFIATSLDGFIAREDGAIDWLAGPPPPADLEVAPGAPSELPREGLGAGASAGGARASVAIQPEPAGDYGYQAFFDSVDALVMGRNTFDLVRTFGHWPYGTKPVVVLTSRPLELPPDLRSTVQVLAGRPEDVAVRLAARGLRRLYVDGGRVVQSFLAAGLVERLILTRIPVLLGKGIPLFGALPGGDVRLRHVRTRTFVTGLVQSEYLVVRGTPQGSAGAA